MAKSKKSNASGGIKKMAFKTAVTNMKQYATQYDNLVEEYTQLLNDFWAPNADGNAQWSGDKALKWANKAKRNQNNHVKCVAACYQCVDHMEIVYDFHRNA